MMTFATQNETRDLPVQRRDVVLVVDDSPDALSLINDTLEEAGMDVLVALEGRQALNIIKKIRPDLILMDGVMPHMDGFETCKAIKADASLTDIPVIFMTGLTETEDIVRGLESGGVDYLVKPVKPNELVARIRVHLSNARMTSSARLALDNAGQHLMTVNTLGQVLWATPQSYALLASAGATEKWMQDSLTKQLRNWIARAPEPSAQLPVNGLKGKLSLKPLGMNESGQWLLRLVDTSLPEGAPKLKDQLGLTERESEVLYWIANGKTNREIAEILVMSPRTVNKHLEQIFPKLGVENRTAAAGIALRALGSSS